MELEKVKEEMVPSLEKTKFRRKLQPQVCHDEATIHHDEGLRRGEDTFVGTKRRSILKTTCEFVTTKVGGLEHNNLHF